MPACQSNERSREGNISSPYKTPALQAVPNINSCLIVTSHFTCPLCLVITNKEKKQTSLLNPLPRNQTNVRYANRSTTDRWWLYPITRVTQPGTLWIYRLKAWLFLGFSFCNFPSCSVHTYLLTLHIATIVPLEDFFPRNGSGYLGPSFGGESSSFYCSVTEIDWPWGPEKVKVATDSHLRILRPCSFLFSVYCRPSDPKIVTT